jgi:hypothetical protein
MEEYDRGMSWRVPGKAIRVVIHDSDGGIGHYSRDQEEDDGRVIWRDGRPDELAPASSDGASMTTVELLDALTRSLQHP